MAANIIPFSPFLQDPRFQGKQARQLAGSSSRIEQMRSLPRYLVQVEGHCLEPEFLDGDTVLIEKRKPKPGDYVSVALMEQLMLKKFDQAGGQTILRTVNPGFYDYLVKPGTPFEVLGVVTQLIGSESGEPRDFGPLFAAGVAVSEELFRRLALPAPGRLSCRLTARETHFFEADPKRLVKLATWRRFTYRQLNNPQLRTPLERIRVYNTGASFAVIARSCIDACIRITEPFDYPQFKEDARDLGADIEVE